MDPHPLASHPPSPEVLAAEEARCAATVAGDADALDALLHDDLRFGHLSGRWDTKADFLERVRAGSFEYPDLTSTPTGACRLGDTELVWLDIDTEVVGATGRHRVHLASLTVWRHGPGGPRLLAHQPTVVRAPEATR